MARGGFHHGQPGEITSGALPGLAHPYGAPDNIGHRGLLRWRHATAESSNLKTLSDTEDEGRVFVSTASRQEYLRWLMFELKLSGTLR